MPIKNDIEIALFPLERIYNPKKLNIVNKRLCEILRPEPNPENNKLLSIKSGIKAPIINDKRLNSNFFFIKGISKRMSGMAI